MKSGIVLQCVKNLNRLGESNSIMIAWTPGHTGVYVNEMADNLTKSGSTVLAQSVKPVIPVLHISCTTEVD